MINMMFDICLLVSTSLHNNYETNNTASIIPSWANNMPTHFSPPLNNNYESNSYIFEAAATKYNSSQNYYRFK